MEKLTEDEQRVADVLVLVGYRREDAERMVREYNTPDEDAARVNQYALGHANGGA